MAEFDLIGINGAEERVKLEMVDLILIHTNLFAPLIEETDPITECPNLENFSWHHYSWFCSPQGHNGQRSDTKWFLLPLCPFVSFVANSYFAVKVAGRLFT